MLNTPLPGGIGTRQWRALLASVALAAVAYLVFSLWGGWRDVADAAARVGWSGAAILLALSGVNYGLRFLRWQLFLAALGERVPWRASLLIYIAGFALTTTPGKVGEAVRSIFLKARGVRHAHSMAAFVSERLSDLLAVALLCSLGWSIDARLRPLIVIGLLLIAAAFVLLAQHRLLERWQARMSERSGRLARALTMALRLLCSARRCHRPGVLALATALSLLAWSAEALAMVLLLRWLGLDAGVAFSCFTYAVGTLAGALSFIPGGLGGAEATMTALLLWVGASPALAVAATVFIRLTTLWFAVALGVLALAAVMKACRRRAPAAAKSSGPAGAAAQLPAGSA